MSNSPDASDSPATVEPPAGPDQLPGPPPLPWTTIGIGISFAGGLFPLIVVFIAAPVVVVQVAIYSVAKGFAPGDTQELLYVLGELLASTMAAGVAGLLLAGMVTLVTIPVFCLFLRSMRLRAGYIWLGAICGGLVGFLAVGAFVVWSGIRSLPPTPLTSEDWIILGFLSCAVGLATVCGQAGGAWGGWMYVKEAVRARSANGTASKSEQPAQPAADSSASEEALVFRFSIRQLLWLTVWLSLLFAAVAATGAPEVILVTCAVWLLFQTATLRLGARLLRWTARRRALRRERREEAALAACADE